MTTTSRAGPGARAYVFLGCGGLLLILIGLLARGMGNWSLYTVLFGAAALLGRWRLGPFLVLAALVLLFVAGSQGLTPWELLKWQIQLIGVSVFGLPRGFFGALGMDGWMGFRRPVSFAGFRAADLALAVGLLAYQIGSFRLLSVSRGIFPADARGSSKLKGGEAAQPAVRAEALIGPAEVRAASLGLPLYTLLAFALWRWIESRPTAMDLASNRLWHAVLTAWLLGVGMMLVAAAIGHVARLRQSPEEALLVLQDALWRETRREQNQINRVLARLRGRRARKEGPP